MREETQKKIDRSIKLLKATCTGELVELAYSGGKDSDVILQLAKEAGINYRAIYKNTTIPKITYLDRWTIEQSSKKSSVSS